MNRRRQLARYGEQVKALQSEQRINAQTLERRLKLQMQELTRQKTSFEKLDRRELAAFLRDERRALREQQRGGSDAMPSLEHLVPIEARTKARAPDVIDTFERAVSRSPGEPPDLLSAFWRAANPDARTAREARDTEPRAQVEDRHPSVSPDNDNPRKPRDRG